MKEPIKIPVPVNHIGFRGRKPKGNQLISLKQVKLEVRFSSREIFGNIHLSNSFRVVL